MDALDPPLKAVSSHWAWTGCFCSGTATRDGDG